MLPSYLKNRAPQCRCRAWSYLCLQSQWHWSSSGEVICEHQVVVIVVPLALALYAPYLLARFWASHPVLFQTLHLKAQVFQLHVDLLNFQVRILYRGLVQSHRDLEGLSLSG